MRPATEEELAEIVRTGNAPLHIAGGGTRGTTPAQGASSLSTAKLAGITLYEPGALTLVARAGTRLSEIEAELKHQRQRLAFEPADWRGLLATTGEPTIGGLVAANISGSRRVQAGAARDATLGVRFVDGTGAIVKNGGRVMKNVTGYDLVKLMSGSWGTLGVLTEVALKVLPVPETSATLITGPLDVGAAVAAMTVALGSPFDVTGAARLPDGRALIRIEGFATSVAYREGRLAKLLSRFGTADVERDPQRSEALWKAVRDVEPFHNRSGEVWRLSVKPSDAPAIVERIQTDVLLDWGGGLIWALMPEGTDLRTLAAPYAGHATLVRSSRTARLPRFEPELPAVARLATALRARFDPRGLFNPGLMG
ncbi:MAG: FAD-binding protein [Paracoccaceae bacterium]